MTRLVRTELLKGATVRIIPALLLTWIALTAFATVDVLRDAGVRGAPSLGTLAHARQLLSIPGLGGALLLLVGILLTAGEHRHGTVVSTYLVTPRRWRVTAAKALAVAGLGLVWAVLSTGIVAGIAVPWAANAGVDLLALLTPEMVRGAALALLVLPLYAVMGVGIGAALGNQVAAVTISLLYTLFAEVNIIAPNIGSLARFLPGTAAAIVGGDHAPDLAWWAGALILAAWAAVLFLVGAVLSTRRDL